MVLQFDTIHKQPIPTPPSSPVYPTGRAGNCVIAAGNSVGKDQADIVCAGVNDQRAWLTAWGSLPACGGSLIILDGDYYFGATLVLPPRHFRSIIGMSGGVIHLADGVNADIIHLGDGTTYNTGNVIRGLRIDGNTANQTTGSGIVVNYCENITLDQLIIKDCKSDGIVLTGTVGKYTTYFRITNSRITTIGRDGIRQDTYCYGGEISNNIISGCLSHGLYVLSCGETMVSNTNFDSNLIGVGINGGSWVGLCGCHFVSQSQNPVFMHSSTYCSVAGCTFSNNSQQGASYSIISTDGTYNSITGNTVSQATTVTHFFEETGIADYNSCSGNAIGTNVTTPLALIGAHSVSGLNAF